MYGVQLYGLKKELKKNYKDTLFRLKEMGIDTIEPFLSLKTDDRKQDFWSWSVPFAKTALEYCNEIGLKYETVHIPIGASIFTAPKKKLIKAILAFHEQIGLTKFVVSGMPMTVIDAKRIGKYLAAVQEEIAKVGCELIYHNHDDEFKVLKDGSTLLDIILKDVPTIGLELDIGWASIADDLFHIIEKYKDNIYYLHFKDFYTSAEKKARLFIGKADFAPIGDGFVRTKETIALSSTLPNYRGFAFIDQDDYKGSMLDAIKKGLENIKSYEQT